MKLVEDSKELSLYQSQQRAFPAVGTPVKIHYMHQQ